MKRDLRHFSVLLVWAVVWSLGPIPGAAYPLVLAQSPKVAAQVDEPIAEVRVVGNRYVPTQEVMALIRTRPGVPPDRELIEKDVRRLIETRQFFDVGVEYLHASHGLVVLFRVLEGNRIREVLIEGNRGISTKNLLERAGLKPGRVSDIARAKDAARRMEDLYRDKGYAFAQVKVVEGLEPGDDRIVIQVIEGPKVVITDVDFAFMDRNSIGTRRLATKIKTKQRRFFLLGGQYNARDIEDDVHRLKAYYRGLGYFDVAVSREIRRTRGGSRVQVIFVISEGPRYRVRSVQFDGNQRLTRADLLDGLKLQQGDLYTQDLVERDRRTISDKYGALGYIEAKTNPDIRFLAEPEMVDIAYQIVEGGQFRVGRIFVSGNQTTKDNVIRRELRIYPGEVMDLSALRRSEQNLRNTRLFFTSGPNAGGVAIRPVAAQEPFPPMGEGLEDQGPNLRDVEVRVQEGQTGRLLFGVGVNSDAGLVGNVLISEQNFDLLRWPRSFDDFVTGGAFRGGGQEFRLEAAPGTEFSRYLVNWREPRLLDLPYSLGLSGYFFQRIFREYDEERGGGRISVGHEFSDFTRGSVGLRIENIDITDPDIPTPPDLLEVLGDNFLTVLSLNLEHDTRDNPFLPSMGHLVNASFHQGFGDFTFPKVTLEGREYWTVSERADGSGRQVISARGTVGFAGDDTPLFERFFAGGFRNFRGFRFRGVGPDVFGVKVGGEFMLLGSLEYQFPVTADDALQLVLFSDFGTVEESVKITEFRVTTGVGLRLIVPMLGPVPLAFDFAVPLSEADTDDEQVFSFFFGFLR